VRVLQQPHLLRNYSNNVLAGGLLTQQWMVESYVKIEANRVKYIREHQAEFPNTVSQYSGLMDYIANRGERKNVTVGSIHIFPSSFIGSPRAMKQAYQDAMAFFWKIRETSAFPDFHLQPKVERNYGKHTQLLDGIGSTGHCSKSLQPKEDGVGR